MKAMVLAAGLGTRLRPLTDSRPKALVEIEGSPLLEITLLRLRRFGVREAIVNVHHFADMVLDYLKAHDGFGMRVEVSREEELLDTGGGLKKAAWFFQGSDEPFILHNVDVISAIDLKAMLDSHARSGALATLAVQERPASRQLLFDDRFQLCGRRVGQEPPELVGNRQPAHAVGFCGIHVISPRLLTMMAESGAFSIIKTYLRLASQGERIIGFHDQASYWRDLGSPANLRQAEADLRDGVIRK